MALCSSTSAIVNDDKELLGVDAPDSIWLWSSQYSAIAVLKLGQIGGMSRCLMYLIVDPFPRCMHIKLIVRYFLNIICVLTMFVCYSII